eukprot:7482090-Ditylum_brightwellii.AAC.1
MTTTTMNEIEKVGGINDTDTVIQGLSNCAALCLVTLVQLVTCCTSLSRTKKDPSAPKRLPRCRGMPSTF